MGERQSTLPAPKPDAKLSPLQWQALRVAAKPADNARDALDEGLGLEVDFKIRIRGTMQVLPGTVSVVKTAPKMTDLVALLLLELGERTRKRVLGDLRARAKDRSGTAFPSEIIADVENLLAAFTVEKEQQRRGAVTGTLDLVRL
jgi:hypothetical protein